MNSTIINTRSVLRVGDTYRIGGQVLTVWHREGDTYSLRREPLNRWGNKMARWRARRSA